MKKFIQFAVATIVAAVIFVGILPRVADLGAAVDAMSTLGFVDIVVLLVLALASMAAFANMYVAAIPGLRLRDSMVAYLSSTAVAGTVPAGGAVAVGVTASMLRTFGASVAALSAGIVMVGIWDIIAKIALPVVLLAVAGIFGVSSDARWGLILAAIVMLAGIIGLLVAVIRSDSSARSVGGWIERMRNRLPARLQVGPEDLTGAVLEFRGQIADIALARWPQMTISIILMHVARYLVLLLSVRAVGVGSDEVSAMLVFASYIVTMLVTAVPVTPGGAGVAELSYITILSANTTDATTDLIAGAVFIFRSLTWLLPIILGYPAWIAWKISQRRKEEPAAAA